MHPAALSSLLIHLGEYRLSTLGQFLCSLQLIYIAVAHLTGLFGSLQNCLNSFQISLYLSLVTLGYLVTYFIR